MDVNNPNTLGKVKGTKPQKKAGAPVVRHTITSFKRMLKANPLLELEMKGINLTEHFNELVAKNNASRPETACKPAKKMPTAGTSGFNKKIILAESKPSTSNAKPQEAGRSGAHSSKTLVNTKPLPKSSIKPEKCTFHIPGNTQKPSRDEAQNKATQTQSNCQSMEVRPEISENPIEHVPALALPTDRRKSNSFTFNTPQAYKRRSVAFLTPQSVRKQSLFRQSTPAPNDMKKLQDRLNGWLKTRGKPPVLFKNMR